MNWDFFDKTPMTFRTMFELASVGKTSTATAVLMLREGGKLSIEDDVRKILPKLPDYPTGKHFALSHPLHHTSGLPDYMTLDEPKTGPKGYRANEDYVAEFARQRDRSTLAFPTGQRYEYNNTTCILLGLVIARASKRSFGTFMRDEVFGPAGMANTFVSGGPAAVGLGIVHANLHTTHSSGSEPVGL